MDFQRKIYYNKCTYLIRTEKNMNHEEIMKLPKIELHCHLDGSLSQQYIEEQLGRKVAIEELQVSDDCRNLAEYLEKFDLPLQCLQTKEGLEAAGYDFIRGVAAENVKYVEVRFAPLLSVNEKLDCRQVITSVIEGLERGKKEFGVMYNVITCVMRHQSMEESKEMLTVAREFLGRGVCAADLAGNEAAFPMSEFMELFGYANEIGLPYTLHAGECGSVENILDSVSCGASRVGHGIAMRGNTEAQKLCVEHQTGVEMCPISNQQTKAVNSLAEYPIREFLDAGVLVTINTDNRTVSNTTISKEIEFVQQNFGIADDEIVQMMKNAVEVSFATEEQKEQMRNWYK